MNDRILINSLVVAATIGVDARERCAPQRLEIDLALDGDFRGLEDDLNRTTDYAAVADGLRIECARSEFHLLETLAEHLAGRLFATFPLVRVVEMEIRKDILASARHAGVRIRRERP
jgi:7,8-dihydroneopterin aldolase/epimerase/oxygenase